MLHRTAPLKSRQRREWEARIAARSEGEPKPLHRLERPANYDGTTGAAAPKPEPKRNRALLDMANGQACLLRVPGVCNGDNRTTVACHSNWAEHGKAGARKADDCYSVWGCAACHAWLDQGKAHHQEKRRAFDAAFAWQREIWLQIVAGLLDSTPKDRRAAAWALDQLETGATA